MGIYEDATEALAYEDIHENKCNVCRQAIRRFVLFKNEINSELDKIREEIMAVGNMVHQHAIGVQNVYNEMMRIKQIYKLTEMDKELFDKIEKIKQINDILD